MKGIPVLALVKLKTIIHCTAKLGILSNLRPSFIENINFIMKIFSTIHLLPPPDTCPSIGTKNIKNLTVITE